MKHEKGQKPTQKNLYKIAFLEILILGVLWQLLATLGITPEYVSEPKAIGVELWEMITSGQLFENAFVSLYRSLAGFTLVAVLGTTLGILTGYFQKLGKTFDPIVAIFNPIPKIALLPIFLVWFGVSETTRILIIFFTAFFPAFIATFDGARSVNQQLVWAGKNMGATNFQILWKIILPASLSKIFDGLRLALGLSFVMMFSSEIIGSSNGLGLGFLILKADYSGQVSVMLAAIVVIAGLGCLFDFILQNIRKRMLWWSDE